MAAVGKTSYLLFAQELHEVHVTDQLFQKKISLNSMIFCRSYCPLSSNFADGRLDDSMIDSGSPVHASCSFHSIEIV